jgi:hypothetical protein
MLHVTRLLTARVFMQAVPFVTGRGLEEAVDCWGKAALIEILLVINPVLQVPNSLVEEKRLSHIIHTIMSPKDHRDGSRINHEEPGHETRCFR